MTDALPAAPKNIHPTVANALGAPIVFFEGASNQGHHGGIINITLVAARHMLMSDGGISTHLSAVADLRCTVAAAEALQATIANALLLAKPTQGSDKGAN